MYIFFFENLYNDHLNDAVKTFPSNSRYTAKFNLFTLRDSKCVFNCNVNQLSEFVKNLYVD